MDGEGRRSRASSIIRGFCSAVDLEKAAMIPVEPVGLTPEGEILGQNGCEGLRFEFWPGFSVCTITSSARAVHLINQVVPAKEPAGRGAAGVPGELDHPPDCGSAPERLSWSASRSPQPPSTKAAITRLIGSTASRQCRIGTTALLALWWKPSRPVGSRCNRNRDR